MPPPRLLVAAAFAGALLAAPAARAEASRIIEQGQIAYQTGNYADCVQQFELVLRPGSPDEARTLDQRTQARMHLGACLLITHRDAEADAQFEQLIRDDYRFSPDRASFPSPVIRRFLQMQARMRDEIEAKIRADQEREAERRRQQEERERQERERQNAIEQMAREQLFVQQNSRLVALVPFGVGQFQNRQRALGWTLLGAQATLAATSAVSYLLKENIERQFGNDVDPQEARRLRDLAVQVNYIAFGALAAVALGGVVHAQFTFVPEFRETRSRPLPPPIVSPMPVGGVLQWQGRW